MVAATTAKIPASIHSRAALFLGSYTGFRVEKLILFLESNPGKIEKWENDGKKLLAKAVFSKTFGHFHQHKHEHKHVDERENQQEVPPQGFFDDP